MKTLRLSAKILSVIFAGSLFLLTSGISSAVLAHHTGETSKTRMHDRHSQIGKLEGKTFTVNLIEPGKSPVTDSLIFRSGSFKSVACRTYGFGMGKYTTKESNNAITFNAKTLSSSEGTMLWKGSVRGNQVQGTVEWLKKNQAKPVEMTFSGSALESQVKTEVSPK